MAQALERWASSALGTIFTAVLIGVGSASLTIWASQGLTEHRLVTVEKRLELQSDRLSALAERAATDAATLTSIDRQVSRIEDRLDQLARHWGALAGEPG